jgi:hypothetical protein
MKRVLVVAALFAVGAAGFAHASELKLKGPLVCYMSGKTGVWTTVQCLPPPEIGPGTGFHFLVKGHLEETYVQALAHYGRFDAKNRRQVLDGCTRVGSGRNKIAQCPGVMLPRP